MNYTKFLLISCALIAVFLSGCQLTTQDPPVNTERQTEQSSTQKETTVSISVNADDDLTPDTDTDSLKAALQTPPIYTEYSPETFSKLKGQRPVVLFFHADWCPVCRVMDKDIRDELATYPMGTNILKVNYDTETELKNEYNIKIQSSVVVLDAEGTVIYLAQDPAIDDFKAAIEASISGN